MFCQLVVDFLQCGISLSVLHPLLSDCIISAASHWSTALRWVHHSNYTTFRSRCIDSCNNILSLSIQSFVSNTHTENVEHAFVSKFLSKLAKVLCFKSWDQSTVSWGMVNKICSGSFKSKIHRKKRRFFEVVNKTGIIGVGFTRKYNFSLSTSKLSVYIMKNTMVQWWKKYSNLTDNMVPSWCTMVPNSKNTMVHVQKNVVIHVHF